MTDDMANVEPATQQTVASIRQLLFHVDNTVHTRINFLLVAESLFFSALSQVWAGGGNKINVLLSLLGIALTLLLWWPLHLLDRRTRVLAAQLNHPGSVDKAYRDFMDALPIPPRASRRMANWIPLTFLVGWLAVLGLIVERRYFP